MQQAAPIQSLSMMSDMLSTAMQIFQFFGDNFLSSTMSRMVLVSNNRSTTDRTKRESMVCESNENIHKKEYGTYYVVSANKTPSVTL